MPRSTTEVARRLLSKALEQGGYFTAKQAKEVGYDYPHLKYHESTGSFEKVGHGLYRLATVPHGEHDDIIRLSLWSRNREDRPEAVLSHESALVLHGLSELLPNHTHLTVPKTFRKESPRGVVLHKGTLEVTNVEERVGFRVTTALRTLTDAATSGTSQEQFEKAAREAIGRGLVRKAKLVTAAKHDPRLHRLVEILEGTK